MSNWWRLTTRADDVESLTLLALENGAAGSHLISDQIAAVFVNGTEESAQAIRDFMLTQGATEVTLESEPEINWVARCNEIWQPIQVGRIRVTPIVDPETLNLNATPTPANDVLEIKLVPNTAFGTGHHESTQQILQLLQDPRLVAAAPGEFFDLGTGTGVLAFAAALLYPEGKVSALDIDPRSVARARENHALNPSCRNVTLHEGTFDDRFGQFDTITANIYAEILCDYEPLFYSHLKSTGHLILAGILEEFASDVEITFADRFLTLERQQSGEWFSYLLRKRDAK